MQIILETNILIIALRLCLLKNAEDNELLQNKHERAVMSSLLVLMYVLFS